MKTNHRRKNTGNYDDGYDYSSQIYTARRKVGLTYDHDGGHRGAAKDIREEKTFDRRKQRREMKRAGEWE